PDTIVFIVLVAWYIWTLPAPNRVFVDSVNMRHILRWRPPQAVCNTTVLFSVQYQGEFELLVKNGTWMDVFDCQQIPFAHCDLSFEVGSDSDYDLQVRAQCGSEVSNWTKLGSPFNRRNSDTLQVLMEEFPLSAAIRVTVWRKDEQQVSPFPSFFHYDICIICPFFITVCAHIFLFQKMEYSLTPEQPMLHIEALQEGKVYCVRAQLMLYSGVRSSSTRPHCVLVTGIETQTHVYSGVVSFHCLVCLSNVRVAFQRLGSGKTSLYNLDVNRKLLSSLFLLLGCLQTVWTHLVRFK
uniref:Fibronectin type-III domain-containing protein n=1 Tax=Oryzias latipes TaxID=8090 RepID=A0A3P9MK39_ORYLA